MGRMTRVAAAALGATAAMTGWGVAGAAPLAHDGPAPCTAGGPPDGAAGYCATYDGANTWYGTYGPGFPVASGSVWCAGPAAGGGDYPVPGYGYAPAAPPAAPGADPPDLDGLGVAFSQAQALTGWAGSPGRYDADQQAVAAKLLYDHVVWDEPMPTTDAGVGAAVGDLTAWEQGAVGATGAATVAVVGPAGPVEPAGATFTVRASYPGTGAPVAGLPLLVSVSGGRADGAPAGQLVGVTTDASGTAAVAVTPTPGAASVTVGAVGNGGQPGLVFLDPTVGDLAAQEVVGFQAPALVGATVTIPTATGTVSVHKTGDDPAYLPVAGATFTVSDPSGAVLATLVTDAAGDTAPSPPVPAGTVLTVHEASPPAGYQTAPDQTVTVSPDTDTVVAFAGAAGDRAVPGTIVVVKHALGSGAPLAGAVFDVAYDSGGTGDFDVDEGTCTTAADGSCSPPAADGGGLLPGRYRVTELEAPPGYWLDPATATEVVDVGPGDQAVVSFDDTPLGSLRITKTADDTAYLPAAGAVFEVRGPAPADALVATVTLGAGGQATVDDLVPGTYTVTETTAPAGYAAAAPVTVTVGSGPAQASVTLADRAVPGQIRVAKVDAADQAPLAGAVFDLAYDPSADGTFSVDVGSCTTGSDGRCQAPADDGDGLLPGSYRITEVTAPPGYQLPNPAAQVVFVGPGATAGAVFADSAVPGAATPPPTPPATELPTLPSTGGPSPALAGTAAGLLAVGLTLVWAGRRRRPCLASGHGRRAGRVAPRRPPAPTGEGASPAAVVADPGP